MDIQPKYLTFADLVSKRLFRIPEYQRAYSWKSKHREDLFDDISKLKSKPAGSTHFMATVVGLQRERETIHTDEYTRLDIVDGQQRLTTLILLCKAIEKALSEADKTEVALRNEIASLLVKNEAGTLLLLQTNHDKSTYFANYLWNGDVPDPDDAKFLADKDLATAIVECERFVASWAPRNSLLELAKLLKNRLTFIFHEIDDESAVYTVFEVLNSRGLVVSWIDRLKSILMGAAFELKKANRSGVIKELHTTWREIYSVIGLRQGLSTEALRFAATLHADEAPSRPLGEEDSVDALRTEASSAKGIRNVASWLLDVTKACDTVIENPRVNAVTRISQARLLATAIHLRSDIKPAERKALLTRWEKVSFRIYGMLGNDARTRVGDYVRLAWQIMNEKPSFKEIDAAIEEIGRDFTIQDAVTNLRNTNCYEGWENEIRYLMFRYEEYLAKQQKLNFSNEQWEKIWMVSPAESIEHIWAKSTAPEQYRHRLGNLVLLPPKLNSKLQDNRAKDKVDAYRKTGLLIAGEVADIVAADGWGTKAIKSREEAILKWATKEWAD